MEELKNTALVTGASSGIGLAISGELARRGYSLLMVSNEDEKLSEEARELEGKYGIRAIPLCMDLAQRDSAQKLFDYCQANNVIIDILVNNAGIFFFRDITDTPPERMETIINLHMFTPAMLSQAFARQMIADNRKGYILNMSSISSRMMMPGITMYSSTKSFLRCFSRSMRNEVFYKGVSITTLSPGAVATEPVQFVIPLSETGHTPRHNHENRTPCENSSEKNVPAQSRIYPRRFYQPPVYYSCCVYTGNPG